MRLVKSVTTVPCIKVRQVLQPVVAPYLVLSKLQVQAGALHMLKRHKVRLVFSLL